MTRLVRRPIAVSAWRGEEPARFVDQAEEHAVELVLDRWLEMGDWWSGEGERRMLRVWTSACALLDLEYARGQWYVYRVWD